MSWTLHTKGNPTQNKETAQSSVYNIQERMCMSLCRIKVSDVKLSSLEKKW